MKVIDLLNKIANGEEVPKKFKYDDNIYYLRDSINYDYDYRCDKDDEIFEKCIVFEMLNDEIEIIKDTPKEDKKIEKVDFFELRKNNKAGISNDTYLACFINEIIDRLNGE